jgi:hypothetical protein
LTGIGLVLLNSETFPGWKEALVMLNWKNKTTTPAGGSSVTVSPTGATPGAGLVGATEVTGDWLLHPVMKRRMVVANNARVALRIFPSVLGPRLENPGIFKSIDALRL